MRKMESDLGIMFILAGNYDGRDPASFPDRCMPYLNGGLLVGAVDRHGIAMDLTPGAEDPDLFAPGVDLPYPQGDTVPQTGTSYGKSEIGLYHFLGTTLTCVCHCSSRSARCWSCCILPRATWSRDWPSGNQKPDQRRQTRYRLVGRRRGLGRVEPANTSRSSFG